MPVGIPSTASPWGDNKDASDAIDAAGKAAAAGKQQFVTHITFNSVPGGTLQLLDADGGNVVFGTITLAANGVYSEDFSANPIEFPHSKAVWVTTTGSGVQCVHLRGYTI